jgi:serine/threonine-protein kinase
LSVDEIKQIFRCLTDEPGARPHARHMRFFNPTSLTTSQVQIPRERINPGPPLGRGASDQFVPGSQSLLVTYSANAPEAAGTMFPLTKPLITIGRRAGQDIVMPEPTVSGSHAVLRWQNGSWSIEDTGSTNGTFADYSYDRKQTIQLLQGAEIQLGESRVKIVSFPDGSPQHERARAYLARRDGLTGLLSRDQLGRAMEDDRSFGEWSAVPLTVARYQIRGPNRHVSDRPAILEMLALRRAAQRVVELTEMLLLSLVPVTAGRTGPLKFAVAMTGPSLDEARNVVEQVVSQVQGNMPETLDLAATIVRAEPGQHVPALLDD